MNKTKPSNITEEEIKERTASLNQKYSQAIQAENEKWQKEISALESRVKTNFIDIDIGNGDTIAIKGSLSEQDVRHIQALDKDRKQISGTIANTGDYSEQDINELTDISYEILEIVTANPLITKEWLLQNPDKFSSEDMMKVVIGYYENVESRLKNIDGVANFRKDDTRPKLR